MDDLLQAWLQQVCAFLPNVVSAAVVADADGRSRSLALWPTGQQVDEQSLSLASGCLARGGSAVLEHPEGGLLVARLLRLTQTSNAPAMVIVRLQVPIERQDMVLRLLAWAEGWWVLLSAATAHGNTPDSAGGPEAPSPQQWKLWFDQIQAGVSQANLGYQLCQFLAAQQEDARVSVGLLRGGRTRLLATSVSAEFNPHAELAGLLEAVMDASAASSEVRCRSVSDDGPRDAWYRLSAHAGGARVTAVPLSDSQQPGQVWAVLVWERAAQAEACVTEDIAASEWLLAMCALLRLRPRLRQAWWRSSGQRLAGLLVGPRAIRNRLLLAGSLVLLLGLTLVPASYRVNADAVLRGKTQRVVVAPFDSYVVAAHYRAGEQVQEGALLAELDSRELRLQLDKFNSNRDEYDKQYRQALAQMDRAQSRIVQAQITQVEAEVQMLQQQLQRSEVRAPFKGVLIRGDLHHSLGAPVARGDVLFEIAPLDQYRLQLEVSERDVAIVETGQKGYLILSALPQQKIPFEVENIAAAFDQQTGETIYRTEARIDFSGQSLRPGMQGIGKIVTGKRSILWIALHDLVDWWRLRVWLWMP